MYYIICKQTDLGFRRHVCVNNTFESVATYTSGSSDTACWTVVDSCDSSDTACWTVNSNTQAHMIINNEFRNKNMCSNNNILTTTINEITIHIQTQLTSEFITHIHSQKNMSPPCVTTISLNLSRFPQFFHR